MYGCTHVQDIIPADLLKELEDKRLTYNQISIALCVITVEIAALYCRIII